MKQRLVELFCDRGNRIDSTKTIMTLTFVLGWIITFIAFYRESPDAFYCLGLMVGAGSGLTVTKGVVDTKQKAQKKEN
ncbi:hypothetical protein [Ignatzschineria cameli]|uniref:DUF2644 domain-containing protein n=1 Tax=Ignatzschineria cameli TaxID=2182793 RepID=A0ABX5L2L7_9GAMM|nr:hypothetical protein [Ignatzschineria cameli]PWD90360.1 hypothetical protein DC079_04255 [Ignatzschineria cameli]PWD92243.1 hypothetical protein DC081_03960 [Ignatzschineria cameli]PWD93037.1 hypothetical protein DC078_04255 [Ignatzschineria cameli]